MPYRIETKGKVHGIHEIVSTGVAKTWCGRTLVGTTGWNAYREIIDCKRCRKDSRYLS